MTDADTLAAALVAHDVPALRQLAGRLSDDLQATARAGLVLLGQAEDDLPPEALEVLRVIAGHPGLALAELVERAGPHAAAAAVVLRERGLVNSTRFERTDCWSRTAAGAAVLRQATG